MATHWQVSENFASKYSSPLDRRLYCDEPLIQALDHLEGKTVLDIGCGNGNFTRALAAKAKQITGVDSSDEMLEQAVKNHADVPNLQFQKTFAEKLRFENEAFDAVVCSMVVNTISSVHMLKEIFKEASRVLKTGGKFGLSLPHPFSLGHQTKFRWTEWEERQSQENLVPSEAITRCFLNANNEVLKVENYYWPESVLIQVAAKYQLVQKETLMPQASDQDLASHPELDPVFKEKPFFLVIIFEKII